MIPGKQVTLAELYWKLSEYGLSRLGPERVLRNRLFTFGKFIAMGFKQLRTELFRRGLDISGDEQTLRRRLTEHETAINRGTETKSQTLAIDKRPVANKPPLPPVATKPRLMAKFQAPPAMPDVTENLEIETADDVNCGQYTQMKMSELRNLLQNRGLVQWGNTGALRRRLTEHDTRQARNAVTELLQHARLGAQPSGTSSLVHEKKFVFFASCYNLAQKTSFCQIEQKVPCACMYMLGERCHRSHAETLCSQTLQTNGGSWVSLGSSELILKSKSAFDYANISVLVLLIRFPRILCACHEEVFDNYFYCNVCETIANMSNFLMMPIFVCVQFRSIPCHS